MIHSSPITAGDPSAPRRVVILHGYTGSPDEFRDFAGHLATRLEAYVTAPLLPGHGTEINDLVHLSFDDIYTAAREHVREAYQSGKPLIIIGHSFSGYLSLLCAHEFPPAALVITVMPYHLRFPLSLPLMSHILRQKLLWDKKLSEQETQERLGKFYYKHMPGKALWLLLEGKQRADKILKSITAPMLAIHGTNDAMAHPDSGRLLIEKTGRHPRSKSVVLDNKSHGIFYGNGREDVQALILQFLETELAVQKKEAAQL
jgi:carboxylesterase